MLAISTHAPFPLDALALVQRAVVKSLLIDGFPPAERLVPGVITTHARKGGIAQIPHLRTSLRYHARSSNSPALAPARNAAISARVKVSTALSGFLESLRYTTPGFPGASSTHAPFALLAAALRHCRPSTVFVTCHPFSRPPAPMTGRKTSVRSSRGRLASGTCGCQPGSERRRPSWRTSRRWS